MSRSKRLISYGVPFFILVLGGALGLVQFSKVRYDFRQQQSAAMPREEMIKMGIKMKKPGEVTIEKELEKLKEMDIDNWENKRGPRPWEENNPSTEEIRKRAELREQKS